MIPRQSPPPLNPIMIPLPKTLTLILTRNRNPRIILPPKTLNLAIAEIRNPKITSHSYSSSTSSAPSPLTKIKPFLQSQWQPILKGWIFSSLSVYCLSLSVPCVGRIPSLLSGPPVGRDTVAREGLALALLALARAAATYLQQAFLWEAALRTSYGIRVHVFSRVLERDLGFFEGSDGVQAGDIAHRVAAEASDVADAVYAVLNTIVPNTLQFFAMSSQMVMLSPVLSLMSALVIPCMSVVITYLGERLRRISRKAHLSVARLSAYLNEVLPSMLVVKANNGELKEVSQFEKRAHDDLVQRLEKRKMKAFIPQVVHVIYLGGLAVLCAASLMISKDSFDLSRLLSFIMSQALLVEPIQGMGKAYNEFKEGEPAIERLYEISTFISKVLEKPDAVDLPYNTGDIKFCNVEFRYGDKMPLVLDGLNLHVKSGERVALIGPSGGGKTTLAKLLLRLYDPLCGCILVDNHDIKDFRLKSLREHITLVPQDINLFSGTVAENIGYKASGGEINMERVENAARIANADEFIRSLPKGYQTNVGPRGSVLSGGQRQRLAIARALYHKSSVLILDEATSALDSRSELLVRHALEHLMSNCTVLVIAHRLETILMADRVVMLDGGKLEEVEKSSLISEDGQYTFLALKKLIV